MDMNQNGLKSVVKTISSNLESEESPKSVANGESDGDDESKALLHSKQDGLPNKPEKPKRKVQWLDKNGDKLAQILEFEPSDVSDSDDDESDSCICTIM